ANFLLALAASLPSTKRHVRRYFCAAVQLPSDWLEVVRIYSACFSCSLPACLKKAMADKFKQFSEYQLAKYNTRKHRCKHNKKKRKGKVEWSFSLSFQCFPLHSIVFRFEGDGVPVDKKQSDFNMKKMIQKLHIKDPAEHVMAILGKKYPSDLKTFTHSGLTGAWNRERAGQRMRLKEPNTWEQLLSREGNKSATWEKLIDSKSLPFMAMLRNLRNLIIKGISEAHHKKILSRLTNQKAVVQSRQFPFRFLSAYKVIMELRAEGLTWFTADLNFRSSQKPYGVELLDRYRKALEIAVQISCRYNVPPLPGKTVILLPSDICSDESWSRKQDFCLPFEPEQKDNSSTFTSKISKVFYKCMARFVAERGSSRLLEHVENLDKKYEIPPPEGAKGPESTNNCLSLPASPKWQGVRVFISSTFRDMHAERDVLVRSVFPELRRRAVPHCLHLQEVELRWGVTEEESERAAELCLSEVCRSQMLVGILGERYGQVPPRPDLPRLPQYNWLSSAPAGMSITEMEICQFQALYPDTANQRMLCYFRDPNIVKSIPVAWRSNFVAESKEAEEKIKSLKTRLSSSDVKVTENYSCEWGGVVEGKPYLKNLEDFGRTVLEDLWAAVQKMFLEKGEEVESSTDVEEQEVHQEALRRQFFGRTKLLSGAEEMVKQVCPKGGMVVIEAGPGEGKTVFMVNVALACWKSKSANYVESDKSNIMIYCLHEQHFFLPDSTLKVSSVQCKHNLSQLTSSFSILFFQRRLWHSMASKAALLQTLTKKKGAILFSLGPLSMPDRKEIVQKELGAFGKKLSDSAFNNQLQTLITKKGAVSPLFLHLACDDLRNFLKESLDALPPSLKQLVQHSLERLCSLHRGMLGLRWALAALTVSNLYVILNICNELSLRGEEVTWQDVLELFRKPTGRIPMATFTRLVHSLHRYERFIF
uniref:TROVE domain-containing protein n=1 Tax=Oryzias sinensis TaxID=183150 RepID=A0A8C7V7G8_9TELE